MDTPEGFVELVFLEVSKAQQNAILEKHSVLEAGGLEQAISRSTFQPQLFSDYVIIDWENTIKNRDETLCVHWLRQDVLKMA